jgi:hypothetical protein
LKYYWIDCPRCQCQVTINTTTYPEKISGSLRRWSTDRSINDGRLFEIPIDPQAAPAGFTTACVCGQELAVPAEASAVGNAREAGLRVDLNER